VQTAIISFAKNGRCPGDAITYRLTFEIQYGDCAAAANETVDITGNENVINRAPGGGSGLGG
jgi:hypothetical protein